MMSLMGTRKAKGDVKTASSQLTMPLSEKDRARIKGSWGFVEKHWNYICVPAFERWFKSYPDLTTVFHLEQYSTISDMVRSPFMMEHMNHVKKILTYVINNIDQREKLTEHLLKLGKRHHKYGADQKYAQAFGVSLTYCLSVSKKWELDDLNAWDSLFRYMINAFKYGIRLGAEAAEKEEAALAIKKSVELSDTAMTLNGNYSQQHPTTSNDDNSRTSATNSECFDEIINDYNPTKNTLPELCKS